MRIIGGTARGRQLAAPPTIKGLRPTTDRVRESIFALVGSRWELRGAEVLDLFAGTGALGCEALSRGAARAVFIEQHREARRTIEENLTRIGHPGQRVIAGDVLKVLGRGELSGSFDVIFLDPPYLKGLVGQALLALDGGELLGRGATVVAEHDPREALPAPGELRRLDHTMTRTYGGTCVSLWELPDTDEEP